MALVFNQHTQIIDVTSPQVTVVVQDLINAIRQEEESYIGLAYNKIANASGKEDLGGGVATGITINLLENWQLRFWSGTYTASITGGNLVGGPAGNPVAYTPGVQVKLVQSAASTIVTTGGSALTQDEHDKLMAGLDMSIPDAVWDELLAAHQTLGSAGQSLTTAKKKATISSLKH